MRNIHLNAFLLTTGHYETAWRHPSTAPADTLTAEHYGRFAQVAERGKLDSVFLADSLAVGRDIDHYSRDALEPFTLLTAIAMMTSRIGLIGTGSTSYVPPFDMARKLASLDHISRGRAGWNIVTSALEDEALNFVEARREHDDRYAVATEFVEVARRLWDSWGDGSRIIDKGAGRFIDAAKVRPIHHHGDYFHVRGPLNMPRPPQGHPLLVQAGQSAAGLDYAARFADAVFAVQRSPDASRKSRETLRSRVARFGRNPDQLVYMPGFVFILGGTEAEAKRREAELNALISPDYGVSHLSRLLETDLSGCPIDGPLPDIPTESFQGNLTRVAAITAMAKEEGMTIRQIIVRLAGGHGHFAVVGTPEQVAGQLESWFRSEAADGFNLMPALLPGDLEAFVDQVVPLLQRRGLFRTEYEGVTLRGHYGLACPAGMASAAEAVA